MIPDFSKLSYRRLLIISACLSIIFSILELLPPNPIDSDAMTYVKTAMAYWSGGWPAALSVYPWPFFPILGAWLSHVLGFSPTVSLHIINTLLQAMLVVCFIAVVKQLGATTRCQRFAACVILIYPFLNAIRVYATRDSGYWAFGLLAVYFLLKFMADARLRYALFWGVAMLIATLFRIEGLIMLCAAPFALLLRKQHAWKLRIQSFFSAYFILICAVLFVIFWHFLHHHAGDPSRLNDFRQQLFQIIPSILNHLHGDADKIRAAILDPNSQENAMTILLGGLTSVYVLNILNVMSPLYFILACYGQVHRLIKDEHGQATLLSWLIIVNAFMLAVFVLEKYFLSTRYPAFMIFLWMSWIPFSLEYLQQRWQKHVGTRWIWPAIVLILIYMAIGGLIRFGYSKAYIPEAGRWIYQNTLANTRLFTNANQITYYASHDFQDHTRFQNITEGGLDEGIQKACQYNWLALRINRGDEISQHTQNFVKKYPATIIFANKRNDRILLYETKAFC